MVAERVRVFSTPACPACRDAKNFLKESDVEFEEVDVAEDKLSAMLLVQRTGQRRVPVIEVDGKLIVGFDEVAVKQALGV